jgi:electron transfer flavoprotein alpha subunit/NAD-dependent dihydropyrimidine dehydrogenase PreA subunit
VPVWIIEEKCTGCGLCVRACPYGGVVVEDKLARLTERCTFCGACLDSCKFEAMSSDLGAEPAPDFSGYRGVWVVAESRRGELHPVTLELLGEARRLAGDLGEDVATALIGRQVRDLAPQLIAHGADTVYVAEHDELEPFRTLPHARVLDGLITEHRPSIVLVGATPQGRDLAPRLSRRLDLGLTADCTLLAIDKKESGRLLQTRPAFGGNVMATIVSPKSRPQMATVRPGVMAALEADAGREGRIVDVPVALEASDLAVVIRSVAEAGRRTVNLSQAKTIVSGGRGVGGADGFKMLFDLAERLGGEVGGTRVAVEEGWVPVERQIGQTGQSVAPELYIAVGISGAVQHRAGIMGARYIVAINRDATAPIFEVADYALIGDATKIVPALIDLLDREEEK